MSKRIRKIAVLLLICVFLFTGKALSRSCAQTDSGLPDSYIDVSHFLFGASAALKSNSRFKDAGISPLILSAVFSDMAGIKFLHLSGISRCELSEVTHHDSLLCLGCLLQV